MTLNLGECYYDHFEKYLGRLADRHVFRIGAERPSIQVLEYHNVFEGCRVYCSLGLTHFIHEVKQIAEVFVPVDEGFDNVPGLVAETLFFIVRNEIAMGRGLAIGGLDKRSPQFTLDYDKSALYFTTPMGAPAAFNVVCCGEQHGSILMGVFISAEEHLFLQEHGVEAFEAKLEAAEADPFHPGRPSVLAG